MLKRLTQPITLPFWWQDLLVSIPRMVCGYLLTADFGADKFGLPWSPVDKNLGLFEVAYWFPEDVKAYGGLFAMFPIFFAWMGAFSEAVGGIFLLVGFQTRIASFLIFSTMLVAIFMQQMGEGIWNMLPAMGFLWVSLFGIILGSGRFGLDFLMAKKYFPHPIQIPVIVLLMFSLTGCVQKSYEKTVVFELDVKDVKNIKTVGIRGNDKPLSWDYSLEMVALKKDTTYTMTATFLTGYKFVEAKFTVNDEFELKDQGNRRIEFSSQDTTFYKATFDIDK